MIQYNQIVIRYYTSMIILICWLTDKNDFKLSGMLNRVHVHIFKSKAIPLTGCGGSKGSEMLKISHCRECRQSAHRWRQTCQYSISISEWTQGSSAAARTR
jgi:hypothetical protein